MVASMPLERAVINFESIALDRLPPEELTDLCREHRSLNAKGSSHEY